MISRDSCMPPDSRNSWSASGNVFESLPARGEPSSALFENSRGLASSCCGLRPGNTDNILEQGERVRPEPQSCTIRTPRFAQVPGPLYRTGGTYFQNCMMETPRCSISELHLGILPDPVDVQCWKVNFRTEVRANTHCPTLTMSWIKEVEAAQSIDDLMTSQPIEHRDFPDFENA